MSRLTRGEVIDPTQVTIAHCCNCPEKLAEIRARLSDLSWWMRLLNQRVAQRANLEDEASGRFFEDRFKAVPLIDHGRIAASNRLDAEPENGAALPGSQPNP